MDSKILVWLVGALVCFVLVIQVVIPASITASTSFNAPGTATGELWTGTAATAHALAFSPVASITNFRKAGTYLYNNTTNLVVEAAGNYSRLQIDTYASNGGVAWSDINITFMVAGANATTNVTWVNGTCNAANKTWSAAGAQTYTGINSSCLTPGTPLTVTFANTTTAGEAAPNITWVAISYKGYNTSTAYTLDSALGQITPTASGYYYTSYTYGTGITGGALAVILLIPLMIAVVLFMLFLRSSGYF